VGRITGSWHADFQFGAGLRACCGRSARSAEHRKESDRLGSIPTLGWLFLLQVITAFALAAAVLATGSRLAAAAGAGFALATLGRYLLAVWVGLFGFKEIRSTAGIAARVIEVAAFATLAAVAAAPRHASPAGRTGRPGSPLLARLRTGIPGTGPALAGISVVALVMVAVSVAAAGGPPAVSARGTLKTAKIGGVTVLTNANGFILYWFAPDTATRSTCYGTCAGYWPPVTGSLSAGPGHPRHARHHQAVRRNHPDHL
jgi:hypothetical protein